MYMDMGTHTHLYIYACACADDLLSDSVLARQAHPWEDATWRPPHSASAATLESSQPPRRPSAPTVEQARTQMSQGLVHALNVQRSPALFLARSS